MGSDEFVKHYKNKLSEYERDEVLDFETVYYHSMAQRTRGIGQYIPNELTCQDELEDEDQQETDLFNHGFDNDEDDLQGELVL